MTATKTVHAASSGGQPARLSRLANGSRRVETNRATMRGRNTSRRRRNSTKAKATTSPMPTIRQATVPARASVGSAERNLVPADDPRSPVASSAMGAHGTHAGRATP
jgi:hypothetical protein